MCRRGSGSPSRRYPVDAVAILGAERIGGGRGGLRRVRWQIEQRPVLVALEEAIEPVQEPVVLGGVGLRGVLDVGADENQAASAAFAVGGGDAGLSTARYLSARLKRI